MVSARLNTSILLQFHYILLHAWNIIFAGYFGDPFIVFAFLMAEIEYEAGKIKLQPKVSWDSNDDSSSLGYGSGTSSNYSDFRQQSDRKKFYKDAEFYDLDSVKSFCLDGCCLNDECPNCIRDIDISNPICSTSERINVSKKEIFFDIDEVEPTEQLQRFSQQRVSSTGMDLLHSIELLKIKVDDDFQAQKKQDEEDFPAKGRRITRLNLISDDHIYEEIHYDTSTINLAGVKPPPLPSRNFKHGSKFCTFNRKRNSSNSRQLTFVEQQTHL